jgi:hypothetical protein
MSLTGLCVTLCDRIYQVVYAHAVRSCESGRTEGSVAKLLRKGATGDGFGDLLRFRPQSV